MKACHTCRFCDDSWSISCHHPKLMKPDPVLGPRSAWPFEERKPEGRCGPEGFYYENQAPLFTRIWRYWFG